MNSVARLRTVALTAVAALVVAACGGGSAGDAPSAADEGPQPGGSAKMIQMSEPRLLDPAVMQNSYSVNAVVGNSIFGYLIADKVDGTFEYGLAESLESPDGGTTWTLTLREGLVYSDGSPVDAEDVAYNWERIKNPDLGSSSAAVAQYVTDMEADGTTLNFTLSEPIANFGFAIVRESLNWVAKPEALEDPEAFEKNPIGAGPFVLESWNRGGDMVLKRNDTYFDDPKPYLDELVLSANADEGQRFATIKSGGADATVASSSAHWNKGIEDGLEIFRQPFSGGIPYWFNARIAPFDEPRAREAVVKAIDLDAVNAAAFEGQGVVPKHLFAEDSNFYNGVELTSHAKDDAQALFDELAAEGKGVEFTITAYQTSESRRVSEAIQAQLSGYQNVDVKLEVLDFPAATAKATGREFQMMPAGLGFIDPETMLFQNLHSDSPGNYSGVSDSEMDDALTEGRISTDVEVRKAAYEVVAERFSAVNPGFIYVAYVGGVTFDPQTAGWTQYGLGSTRTDGVWTTNK
ncbi:ABC transporter substrate-binding protein [Nocardioides sp.]|uniref:ABC transporter substrate-binding protein n=1 Tax=Nocardioides sp. TaxID=35761 RepID=UPI0027322CF9|nr:ABC transporter substrate-binding protein [Nocardioides sp.]MDP3890778.1 ABC transporter substrate-binding protein [Nocardioides sp.]